MRSKARKILFEKLEKEGWQWVIFNEEEPNRNNAIIEIIIDAMEEFKNKKSKRLQGSQLNIDVTSSSQECPQCSGKHDNEDWNGYCSKNCFFGLPKI